MKKIKLHPVGSFNQNEKEVIALLKRKHKSGKLSEAGKEFLSKHLKSKN